MVAHVVRQLAVREHRGHAMRHAMQIVASARVRAHGVLAPALGLGSFYFVRYFATHRAQSDLHQDSARYKRNSGLLIFAVAEVQLPYAAVTTT